MAFQSFSLLLHRLTVLCVSTQKITYKYKSAKPYFYGTELGIFHGIFPSLYGFLVFFCSTRNKSKKARLSREGFVRWKILSDLFRSSPFKLKESILSEQVVYSCITRDYEYYVDVARNGMARRGATKRFYSRSKSRLFLAKRGESRDCEFHEAVLLPLLLLAAAAVANVIRRASGKSVSFCGAISRLKDL